MLARLGQDLDPDQLVGDLPIGKQQLVEIARVLLEDVRILIMDEPTSALSNHEVDVLFGVMDDLRRDDVTIIYISHKLDEFRRIGDYVTVLRDGAVVAHEPMVEHRHRLDRPADGRARTRRRSSRAPPGHVGDVLLEVAGLTVPGTARPLVDDVSLDGPRRRGRRHLRADGGRAHRARRGPHGQPALDRGGPVRGRLVDGATASGPARTPGSPWSPRTASATDSSRR